MSVVGKEREERGTHEEREPYRSEAKVTVEGEMARSQVWVSLGGRRNIFRAVFGGQRALDIPF